MMRGIAIVLLAVAGAARATVPARATGLEAAIAKQVQAGLPAGMALIEVAVADAVVWGANSTVAVHWPNALKVGQSTVLATVREGEKERGRFWARLTLGAVKRVLVAVPSIDAGATITEGDLALENRVVGENEGLDIEPSALLGATAAQEITAGAVVGREALSLPPPLPQGAPVKLTVRRGPVMVSLAGILERATRPGEIAIARSTIDRRILRGRLIDRATILVGGEER